MEHRGLQNLRQGTEGQRDIVLEAVLLSFRDDLGDLLERTEHDHARCALFPFHGFFLQQPVTEMEIFCDIESEVGVECRFPGLIALSIPVISVHIPIRAAGVEVRPDVIRDVGDHQLCLGDVILARCAGITRRTDQAKTSLGSLLCQNTAHRQWYHPYHADMS